MRSRREIFTKNLDWPLLLATLLLAIIGIINLRSTTYEFQESLYLVQILWLLVGFSVAALVASIDVNHVQRLGYILYWGAIFLLVLVLFVGKNIKGSIRWIDLGFSSFQPSEFTKLAVIIVIAKYFQDLPNKPYYGLRDIVGLIILMILPLGLIIIEPDLGTAIIVFLIFLSVLFFTKINLRTLGILLCTLILAVSVFIKDYQKERIFSFLNPEKNRLGSAWHSTQSTYAIGSGRFWGKGFMNGTQTHLKFLPENHSDFILATWAEEQGFMGCIILIGLYLFLIIWGFKIGISTKEKFCSYLAIGVSAMIFWQTIINIGMVIGILPVVGVPLPLLSYGGSSLITVMIGIGLLMNISIQSRIKRV